MGVTGKDILLHAENLWKEYPVGKNLSVQVLKGLDVEIRNGEILVIVGPSGSGKSTLLHILGGLDRPTSGKVIFENQDIFSFSEEKLASFRNSRMGFVFQFHHLLSEFTALENVAMPALIGGKSFQFVRSKAEKILKEIGLGERLNHKPNELSGGEQQRIAVARALMNNPKLIFADEPSGNLDEENAAILHDLLVDLSKEHETTFVIATHNPSLTKRADRVMRLADGKILPSKHVLQRP